MVLALLVTMLDLVYLVLPHAAAITYLPVVVAARQSRFHTTAQQTTKAQALMVALAVAVLVVARELMLAVQVSVA